MTCEHQWEFLGVVYSDDGFMAGSSAMERKYEDCFYCKKCLQREYKNPRVIGNNFVKPLAGCLPK